MNKWLTGMVALAMLALLLPGAAVAQAPVACAHTYVVQAGDWLAKIAARYYDNPWAYPTIVFATNSAVAHGDGFQIISDPYLIEPGWKLCIPDLETAMGAAGVDTLKNIAYRSEWTRDGTALLVDGEYSEPAAPGSATRTAIRLHDRMAFGYAPDGQQLAAAVLVTNPGGSGTFYDLAAIEFKDGEPRHVASLLLGDRVQIMALALEDGEIVVEMIAHSPDDPLCCPTQRVVARYVLKGEALVQVSKEVVADTSDIVRVVWEWERFVGGDGSVVEVDDPSQYTLLLNADGTYRVRADCNRASGGYTMDGAHLTLQPGPTTLAECEPGSLYDVYLADLGDVRTYVRDAGNDRLVLNLWADAGDMIFRPVKTAHLPEVKPDLDLAVTDIQLDTQGLHASWEAVVVPESPYDQSLPPGPTGLPAHVEILFGGSDPADRPVGDPIVYLIPVDAYQQMWDEEGNATLAGALDQIADRTYIVNAPGSVTALPFEEIRGRIDLAVQVGRAVPFGQLNETSAAQSGYRFVGRWVQDANPVTNRGLTYVYQGFTNDGRYVVSFFFPIRTEALPSIDDVPQAELDRLNSDLEAYMAERTALLNGLDSASFTPSLATLDALVASLEIDGMAVSGLQDKTWQWISGPAQPGSSEVITIAHPELYQVTYASDGTVDIVADCNRASLSYELRQGGLVGDMLAMPGPMTLAECEPESHYRAFVSSLEAAQSYRVHPGGHELSLILPAGGGELILRQAD